MMIRNIIKTNNGGDVYLACHRLMIMMSRCLQESPLLVPAGDTPRKSNKDGVSCPVLGLGAFRITIIDHAMASALAVQSIDEKFS